MHDSAQECARDNMEPPLLFYYAMQERTPLPMVMLLGNHSSGKSTFINYLLNQKEQVCLGSFKCRADLADPNQWASSLPIVRPGCRA